MSRTSYTTHERTPKIILECLPITKEFILNSNQGVQTKMLSKIKKQFFLVKKV